MHTFYYPGHTRHDPEQLRQPDTTQLNNFYFESARRGEIIHEALRTADLGPITGPGDFSLNPIGEVHEYGLLNLLQNAHERMVNEEGNRLAVPDTFPKSRTVRHKPRSVWGLLGRYAFDTTSPILEHTWDVAYWNVQVAISAAALVHAKGSDLTYALCRPPGHHAGPDFYGGYCYLNSAAVAAHWLVQQGQRVAILDLDYHHGNGTQAIFYGRSDVLFCSLHADPLYAYPYFWGYADEHGASAGSGYNINYPLPRHTGETAYLETLDKALERIHHYVPDTLLVSFGADVIAGDPVGSFQLQTNSLTKIGKAIASTEFPIIVVQEGGYRLPTLGDNVVAFLSELNAAKT